MNTAPNKPPAPAVTAPTTPEGAPTPPPPRRGPGHRGADVRDTVAEMAAKAQEISMEAGSKMAAAMKDVINAAAGLTGFVVESSRDLVQYMVRRGQMTQEEADKLIREAEEHHAKRKPAGSPAAAKGATRAAQPAKKADAKKEVPAKKGVAAAKPSHAKAPAGKPAVKKAASKPAAKAAKSGAKAKKK